MKHFTLSIDILWKERKNKLLIYSGLPQTIVKLGPTFFTKYFKSRLMGPNAQCKVKGMPTKLT